MKTLVGEKKLHKAELEKVSMFAYWNNERGEALAKNFDSCSNCSAGTCQDSGPVSFNLDRGYLIEDNYA